MGSHQASRTHRHGNDIASTRLFSLLPIVSTFLDHFALVRRCCHLYSTTSPIPTSFCALQSTRTPATTVRFISESSAIVALLIIRSSFGVLLGKKTGRFRSAWATMQTTFAPWRWAATQAQARATNCSFTEARCPVAKSSD
jgi:hypothetical protein